jgi:hypothetical protein
MSSLGLLRSAVHRLVEESAQVASRFVDLGVRIVVADVDGTGSAARWRPGSDEVLAEVGGIWDRRTKEFLARRPLRWLTVRLHRGQERAARWLAEWLTRYARAASGAGAAAWAGVRRIWTALLIGGRRSGKSYLSVATLAVFAAFCPRAIVWAVSPTRETGEELDRALQDAMPLSWYKRREGTTGTVTTYTLGNGAKIFLRSGAKAPALKQGRVDLVLLNEAQLFERRSFTQVRGAIADRAGLVLLTANPPEDAKGRWVEELFEGAESEEVDAIAFELDPRNNPFVEDEVLESMRKEVDSRTFEREVLGKFTPIGDVVFYAWSDRESWRDPPTDLVDITAEVTRRELGRAAGYVVGMDFQKSPHMVAVVLKVFRDPKRPSEELVWVVDEVLAEEADEYHLIDSLEGLGRWTPAGRLADDGYRGWVDPGDDKASPVHCAVVADASGWFQDGAHTKGRTSDQALRARKWTSLYKPQRDSDRNPDLVERCKVGNARMKAADGVRRLFVARHCKRTAESLRRWEIKNGVPYRKSDFAHLCDAVTYPLYRIWGRPKASRRPVTYDRIPLPGVDRMKGL